MKNLIPEISFNIVALFIICVLVFMNLFLPEWEG